MPHVMKIGDVVMIKENGMAWRTFPEFTEKRLVVTDLGPSGLPSGVRWITVDDIRGFYEDDLVIVGHPCPMGGVND